MAWTFSKRAARYDFGNGLVAKPGDSVDEFMERLEDAVPEEDEGRVQAIFYGYVAAGAIVSHDAAANKAVKEGASKFLQFSRDAEHFNDEDAKQAALEAAEAFDEALEAGASAGEEDADLEPLGDDALTEAQVDELIEEFNVKTQAKTYDGKLAALKASGVINQDP